MNARRNLRRLNAQRLRAGDWGAWEHVPKPELAVRASKAGYGGADRYVASIRCAYVNNVYAVQVFDVATAWGGVVQLSVRRHDGAAVRSWPDLQRIKNELCGEQSVAVELYPAQRHVVDDANLYHLWVLPPGVDLPFGLHLPTAWGGRGPSLDAKEA